MWLRKLTVLLDHYIIVWADKTTRFYGGIAAKGGEEEGNGGFAEVSGKQYLAFAGKVDLSAVNGNTGTLLLDPLNITIADGGIDGWWYRCCSS